MRMHDVRGQAQPPCARLVGACAWTGTHVRLTWVFSFPIPSPVAYALSDATIAKQLVDKIYEKRKAAALELEKYRHCIIPILVH